MNYWKDIPPGDDPPVNLNMIIEVTTGKRDKFEYDLHLEIFVLDRVIPSSVVFPVDYGFVPQTWAQDEDPLDIMVMTYEPLEVGCLVKVRLIGALIMEDEKGIDAKMFSVPVNDARFDGYKDIKDIHPHKLRETQEFFETYKRLEPRKWVKIKEWKNVDQAKEIVNDAIKKFYKIYPKE